MTFSRLDALIQMVKRDGDDSFLRYALAIEYAKFGHFDQSIEQFTILNRKDPGYLPAYYHLGKTLENAGRSSEAVAIYETGVKIGRENNDLHTVSELEQALEELRDSL